METRDRLVNALLDLRYAVRAVYGDKSGQRRILLLLSESGAMSQRELMRRLGVCPSSASEILTKMVRAGLVERQISGTRANVRLTDAGQLRAVEAAEAYRKARDSFFSRLNADEERTLLSMIERLSDGQTRERKQL